MRAIAPRLSAAYGPMLVYRVGTRRYVLISDHELAQTVFRSRPGTYRRLSLLSTVIEEIVGSFVFTAEGEAWRRLRTLAMETLSASHQRSFFPTLERATARLQRHWSALADRGVPIDVQADLMRFTVD